MSASGHEAATLRLLVDMETLRRLTRLYPPTHPALPNARQRVVKAAEALAVPALSLAFGPDAIFLDQQEIGVPKESPAVRLRQLLCRLGLAAIHLTFPDALRGLPAFVDRLAQLHDPPGEDDREKLLADAEAFPGIELVPLDLSRVQLVDETEAPPEGMATPVWAELARRLGQDGAFVLADKILAGELTPQILAELGTQSADPATLFDQVFGRLAELVQSLEDQRRRLVLQQIARFLEEWLPLLTPERRYLAIVAAATHFPPRLGDGTRDENVVALDLLLEAVEYLLSERLPVPEVVLRAIARLAAMSPDPALGVSEAVVARCRALQVRISLVGATATTPEAPVVPLGRAGEPAAPERLAAYENALTDEQVRLDLLRTIGEVMTLWPDDVAAERAAERLAEELVSSLEVGDLTAAARAATLLSATRFAAAKRTACDAGVPAAVRAYTSVDRSEHGRVSAVLVALGEEAIPAILEALANEENMSVRKRLMEVVLSYGQRALPYLRSRLDDPRWYVVRNAVFLLRRLGDAASLPTLKERLAGAKPQVVAEILKSLVALEDPRWLDILLRELRSDDEERRLAVLGVAARIRHPHVVQGVVEELRRQSGKKLRDPFTLELIRALGRLGGPQAVEALVRIVNLRRWLVGPHLSVLRREAALALARIDDPQARAAAQALAADRDEAVAAAVRHALRQPVASEEQPS